MLIDDENGELIGPDPEMEHPSTEGAQPGQFLPRHVPDPRQAPNEKLLVMAVRGGRGASSRTPGSENDRLIGHHRDARLWASAPPSSPVTAAIPLYSVLPDRFRIKSNRGTRLLLLTNEGCPPARPHVLARLK